jgi:alkanesulfonate monooxygenase SsuD/methylene tetrahydromethanopterin reductase-like flavin-dependent oxidoreductase (luciferase family)
MDTKDLGIGVPGSLGRDAIGGLAALAEQLGYRSFWFNCVAPHADPVALLDAALANTDRIEVGTGVVPLDGYPSAALAARLEGGRGNDPRVVFGIGSGATRHGALRRVIDGIVHLRTALPRARVAVGAKRPRMVTIGAAVADGLLFSMLTPAEATSVMAHLDAVGRSPAATYAYHRVALDPGGADRVHQEMVSHGAWARDGAPPGHDRRLGSVLPSRTGTRAVVDADLAAYPSSWRPVLRPLPAQPDDLDEWRDLFGLLVSR